MLHPSRHVFGDLLQTKMPKIMLFKMGLTRVLAVIYWFKACWAAILLLFSLCYLFSIYSLNTLNIDFTIYERFFFLTINSIKRNKKQNNKIKYYFKSIKKASKISPNYTYIFALSEIKHPLNP